MRAREFVSEQKSILSRALPTTFQYPGMLSSNPYDVYRFGIAMADHKTNKKYGPANNYAVIVAYTQEEEDIIRAAEIEMGQQGHLLSDRGSNEELDTDTKSPVKPFAGYPR